jgi:NAD(P)-dependent dehydrogenase (short-subunit alcohol dehydrogenase family)
MQGITVPELTGRHAVVTGGGRGIGLAIAEMLALEGASVTLVGRDRARLEAAAASLASDRAVDVATCDVADEHSVAQAFGEIRARNPRIDILVNNAGQAESAPFAKTDSGLWQRTLGVNLTGTYLCTRQVVPEMVERRWGRVVNVVSTAGLVGYAYVTAYCAAKHGVIGLTRSLALETARTGVTVNAVCPGYTETDIVKDAVTNIARKTGKSESEARAALVSRNPQGRMIQPAEVANAVRWLCLPGTESVTGQALSVSGGEVM